MKKASRTLLTVAAIFVGPACAPRTLDPVDPATPPPAVTPAAPAGQPAPDTPTGRDNRPAPLSPLALDGITASTTVGEILERFGPPHSRTGSGISILNWRSADGRVVTMGAADLRPHARPLYLGFEDPNDDQWRTLIATARDRPPQ